MIKEEANEILLRAAAEGDIEALKAALAAGADVNGVGDNDDSMYCDATALIYAAEGGYTDCVDALLAAGADVDARDYSEVTALQAASANGHLACVALLIEAGADLDAVNDMEESALYIATEGVHIECMGALIAAGADVDAANHMGHTPLLNAASAGSVECVKLLLAAGADADARDENGFSVLMAACASPDCLRLLIEAGADVNAADADGITPLQQANRCNCSACIDILKAAGAEGDYEIQQEDEDDDDDFDDEDSEEETTVWEGTIRQMWKYKMYFPGTLSKLLHVGENDRLMYVNVCANESSNEWSQEDEYIVIFLKRDGDDWQDVCWPRVPNDDADPHFPEDWNWQEILDLVWEEKTVSYTTKLNEDCEQIEATWEVEK